MAQSSGRNAIVGWPLLRVLFHAALVEVEVPAGGGQWRGRAGHDAGLMVDVAVAVGALVIEKPLRPWSDDRPDGSSVRESMSAIMRLRLPLDTRLVAVLPADGLTMLICERRIDGAGPDGEPVRLHGIGCTGGPPQHDGSWRIAADAWQLSGNGTGQQF